MAMRENKKQLKLHSLISRQKLKEVLRESADNWFKIYQTIYLKKSTFKSGTYKVLPNNNLLVYDWFDFIEQIFALEKEGVKNKCMNLNQATR